MATNLSGNQMGALFQKYPNANIVYGSWTTPRRKELSLEKTHYNDALVISLIQLNSELAV